MNSNRVLLVEDAIDMQMMVRTALIDVCELKCVETLQSAETEIQSGNYALVLLDVTLPDGDGFEFCKKIRSKENLVDLPIIFLTGQTELQSRVLGFQLGADDYVTKPFEPLEFKARVEGKLKRNKKPVTTFRQAGFRVDLAQHKVFATADDGTEKPLSLTPIEYKLLTHFLQHGEKIFSRQELLNLFWGEQVHVSGHTVDTHISSLRKKMGESGSSLRSVFKKGYCFSTEPKNS